MSQQPPIINGVMELTSEDFEAIKTKLVAIRGAFVPDDQQSVCDTFYIVSNYNRVNKGKEINGDTAEFILN